jgi:hypothetical protein
MAVKTRPRKKGVRSESRASFSIVLLKPLVQRIRNALGMADQGLEEGPSLVDLVLPLHMSGGYLFSIGAHGRFISSRRAAAIST